MNYEDLRQFATTDRQREILETYLAYGSERKAARALGVTRTTISEALRRLKLNQASGNSMLFRTDRETGETTKALHWVKLSPVIERQVAIIQEMMEDGVKAVEPRPVSRDIKLPSQDADLLQLYPEGDPHWGMRVWGPETDGTDYDLDIAYEEYITAIDYLAAHAPNAGTGISLNIGDNFHADDPTNRTKRSGHILNVDGRLSKVFDVVRDARVYKVEQMLRKHDRVIVVEIPGNHDDVMAIAFRKMLRAYYRNEPRVTVADLGYMHSNVNTFWYHRFGKVLLGATHGDKVNPADLPILMATDNPADWGKAETRHCFIGHLHHKQVHRTVANEQVGAVVEMLRTLAARNEFEHGAGYRSGREMWTRTYHREYGDLFTNRIDGRAVQYLTGGGRVSTGRKR